MLHDKVNKVCEQAQPRDAVKSSDFEELVSSVDQLRTEATEVPAPSRAFSFQCSTSCFRWLLCRVVVVGCVVVV